MMIVWLTNVQRKVENKQMKSNNFDSIYKLLKNINNIINIKNNNSKCKKKNLKTHKVVTVIDFKEIFI